MKRAVVIVGIAVAACFGPVGAQAEQDPTLSIQSVQYKGSGCPQDSVDVSVNDDGSSFTVAYDAYKASVGPGIAPAEANKYCSLQLDVRVPQGWTFTVGTFDMTGFAELPDNVKGLQKAIFSYDWSEEASASRVEFEGPLDQGYAAHDIMSLTPLPPRFCDGAVSLSVDTSIRISPGDGQAGQGQLSTQSPDGKVMQVIGVNWIRC